jgi:hypothetical protein
LWLGTNGAVQTLEQCKRWSSANAEAETKSKGCGKCRFYFFFMLAVVASVQGAAGETSFTAWLLAVFGDSAKQLS